MYRPTAPDPPERASPIFIVSGGVGASGEQVVRSALAQFADRDVPLVIVPHVRRPEQVAQAVTAAAARQGLIVHTLVDAQLRQALVEASAAQAVVAIDLLGPLLDHLAATLRQPPLAQPGRYRQLHATSLRRIAAIEFTLAHDDGQLPHDWPAAEVVLLGVSRAGKTPTSVYLAALGWKVANVPLVPEVAPPAAVFALDRRRVIGLTIDPSQLTRHRRGRQLRPGGALATAYTDAAAIYEEVEAARAVMRRGGFRVVDVSEKPIEQIADEIIRLVPGQ